MKKITNQLSKLLVLIVIFSITSCTIYKGQTPDDIYYSPQSDRYITSNNYTVNNTSNDIRLRYQMYDYRFRLLDYDDWYYQNRYNPMYSFGYSNLYRYNFGYFNYDSWYWNRYWYNNQYTYFSHNHIQYRTTKNYSNTRTFRLTSYQNNSINNNNRPNRTYNNNNNNNNNTQTPTRVFNGNSNSGSNSSGSNSGSNSGSSNRSGRRGG